MSVASNNILKLLSDLSTSSDKIAEEFKLPPLSEWISVVKDKADSIVESERPMESEEIPTLMSYIGTTSRGPRVSTVLTEIQRRHLHKNAKVSIKAHRKSSRKSSIRTPLLRRSSVKASVYAVKNSPTPKLKIPTIIKITGNVNVDHVGSTSPSIERNEATPPLPQPLETFTPDVNEKGMAMKMKDKHRSSKRKSSSEITVFDNKKPKINDSKEREKSAESPKVLETKLQMKAKNSSLLPNYANIKSSVGMTNNSVLKENRTLRTKLETKLDTASKNLKSIMALRQQKVEQNKKLREEKMEKTLQQRLKLEKEKQEQMKLRSGREKTVVTTPKKPMQKVVAASKTLKNVSDKNSMKSDKMTCVKNLKMEQMHKKMGTSEKGNENLPAKKNQKEEKKILNSTFAIEGEPSTSGSKGKTLKGAMKDISRTPQALKKQLTPSQKKVPESYAITPARSSFVSYDISEIRSDSEDEEQETNSKPIPSWATGVRLRNALLQQHHHPIDTDELFGNVVELPDLTLIMGVSKKHYKKRTSSAVWNSSFA